ncbi:MAG TPA: hypothetical protein PKK85_01965, partial [Methanobacteriaceae archaeon]|nr:hypothetical protein [Methanobacteriaceae archaeon]
MLKQHLLLIMLLLLAVTLSAQDLHATPNQQSPENFTNSITNDEITVNTTSSVKILNSTVNETVSNTNSDQPINTSWTSQTLNSSQYSPNEENNSTANIQNSSIAAGDGTYNNVHGIWLSVDDVKNVKVEELITAGITDVFVKANRISNPTYQSVLTTIIGKLQGTGIRIHAWVVCFVDSDGKWVDPQGNNTYTVKV